MKLSRLKELLESGAITQEDYDSMVATAENDEPTEPIEPTEPTEPTDPATDPTPKPDDVTARLYQSKLDREMAKERKEKAELKRRLEQLQKKVLTDEEKRQLEFEQQQQELEEQRKELTFERNKMYAVKALKKAEINDSDEALLLMEKLVASCADEAEIDDTIALLKAWRDKDVTAGVEAEVDKRFKAAGYTPAKGTTLNNGVNPWVKEQQNLTKQMEIEVSNPELAAQLKAAAGIK